MEPINPYTRTRLDDIHVILNYGPLGLVHAVAERIGRNRIQLNTGTITLNHNALVEVVMSIPCAERHEHHRISARVTQCGSDGRATLSFHDCCHKTLQALLPYVTLH